MDAQSSEIIFNEKDSMFSKIRRSVDNHSRVSNLPESTKNLWKGDLHI